MTITYIAINVTKSQLLPLLFLLLKVPYNPCAKPVFPYNKAQPIIKGEAIRIKPTSLTPFWHRRVCEATILIDAIILALFAWTSDIGISHAGSNPHGPDENIRLDDFLQSIRMIGRVISKLAETKAKSSGAAQVSGSHAGISQSGKRS